MPVADLFLIALVVTLEPLPLVSFLLVLSGRGGSRNGLAFIAGWVACLAVVVVGTLLVTGNSPPRPATAPSTAILGLKLAGGIVLVGLGVRRRVRRGAPRRPPAWQSRLDHLGPWMAAGVAVVLQPWMMVGLGAATVAQMQVGSASSVVLLVAFAVLCTASYIALELFNTLAPERAATRLAALRRSIEDHTDTAVIALSVGLGLWLFGDSLYLLVTA